MSAPVGRVAGLILAAGASSRYGGLKLLSRLEDRPLLQHVIDAANGSTLAEVVVVVGHAADRVLEAVRLGRARTVRNEAYALGRSTSLAAGLRAASDVDGVLVLNGDQPRVTAALVDAVLDLQRATRSAAVICSWEGQRSPPTLLHRDIWPAVEATTGDVGARDVLAARDDVGVLEVTGVLGSLEDVDRPEDLARVGRIEL